MLSRAAALSFLGGAAASAVLPPPAFAQTTKVRIGTQTSEVYAEPLYGADAGIFAQQGLDVEVVQFNNAAIALAALIGGSVDIAGNDAIELANGVNHGLPLVFIAGGALYRSVAPTILFCVDKGSTIAHPKELEGQTIAVVTLGGLMYTVTRAWLAQNGADIEKIAVIELPASQLAVALSRGRIAGATIPEPALSAAKPAVRILGKPYDSVAKVFQISSWLTTRDWLSRNPETVGRVVRAIYATARWANAHQADSLRILSKYNHLNLDDTQSMTRAQYSTSLPTSQLQPLVDIGLHAKTIERPIDISKFIAPA
jgi:NitT/TauT family transport system substrate-binding protein